MRQAGRVRLALVAPAPWGGSRAGERAGKLLAALGGRFEVRLFVEPARAGERGDARSADALFPRDHDQILYVVGDEAECGFLPPLVRALGGAVSLEGWSLERMARAAWPALAGAGLAGRLRAWREGGWDDARRWASGSEGLVLNRSIVRFGDAFLVPDEPARRRLLDERNAPTPIAVVPVEPAPGEAGAATWREIAEGIAGALERFPRPRSALRNPIGLRLSRALARARERRTRGASPPAP